MLATIVLIIVYLSWPVVVELTPVDRRSYVGSSRDYSVIELILGYNGLDRLREIGGGQGPAIGWPQIGTRPAWVQPAPSQGVQTLPSTDSGSSILGALSGYGGENGAPGPLRLINEQLAGQAS